MTKRSYILLTNPGAAFFRPRRPGTFLRPNFAGSPSVEISVEDLRSAIPVAGLMLRDRARVSIHSSFPAYGRSREIDPLLWTH
jgi:hypothetical protein